MRDRGLGGPPGACCGKNLVPQDAGWFASFGVGRRAVVANQTITTRLDRRQPRRIRLAADEAAPLHSARSNSATSRTSRVPAARTAASSAACAAPARMRRGSTIVGSLVLKFGHRSGPLRSRRAFADDPREAASDEEYGW